MSRSWKDVKADKAAADREAGRDVEAARTAAREATQAYVLGFRPPTSAPDRPLLPGP
ncbi:hypothetical protein [Amycolatopsis sp. NPDC004378]